MAKREAWPCVDWYRAVVTMDWRSLLKSEMGLLCRRRNRTSLKLRRSFGSNSDGKERGLALCGLVPGCCDNGLKEMQLRKGERDKNLRRRCSCAGERERERKFEFIISLNSRRAESWISGQVWNFLRAKWSFCHLVRC